MGEVTEKEEINREMKRGGVKAEPEGACSRCTGGGQDWKGRAEM